ncbi:MAG TPA: DUF1800 domain-containing protein [Candidatus Eremiobacteraceae bacterium]|nr:DUF1800 domain-containing protein [Candidatus Eremiobacteraceae bacterium]
MSADQSTVSQYRPNGSLDPASALAPHEGPWTPKLAAHLLRRAGFGGSSAEIETAAHSGMQYTVTRLINFTPDLLPRSPEADLSYGPGTEPAQRRAANVAIQLWFLDRCLQTTNPLQERMVYFWSNHFTSAVGGGATPEMLVNQYDVFRKFALGNFGDLTHEVSRDPAMLFYLNGAQNNKRHPNENYARELMELFTLGVGNYTEDDVRESARAFTGWTVNRLTGEAVFVPRLHDEGSKTFLGQTGNFNGDDVVNIILRQPAAAQFVAHKFLSAFVYDDPEPELVKAAADLFRSSGYDVRTLVSTLLRSNVFYSPRAYRALVKSPLEIAIGTLKIVGATSITPAVDGAIAAMGQITMRPPNVAGWPGGAQWLNQSTVLARLNFVNRIINATQPAQSAGMGMSAATNWLGDVSMTDAGAVAERVLWLALQDDVTESQRSQIVSFLQTDGVGNLVALNGENIDEKIRGAMSLAMAMPSYQLA